MTSSDGANPVRLRKVIHEAEAEDLKRYLESLSESLMAAFGNADQQAHADFIRKYCTPDFSMLYASEFTGWPRSNTVDEAIHFFRDLRRASPGWRVAAYNFTASVGRELDSAVVWWTSGPTGNPTEIYEFSTTNRESVSKLMWRKRAEDNEWECFAHEVMRGGGLAAPMSY